MQRVCFCPIFLDNKLKSLLYFYNTENSMEQEPTSTFVTYLIDPEMSQQPTTVSGGVGGNSGMLNSNSHSHSHSTKCTSDDDDDSSSITSESGQLGGMNSHTNSAHYSSSPLRMKPFKRKIFEYDNSQ